MGWFEDAAAARMMFDKAWGLQVIAGAALTAAIWATIPYLWRIAIALNPPLLVMLFFVIPVGLFTLRKLYRFVFGCTEFGVASMTVLSAASGASQIAISAQSDNQQPIELTLKFASAVYLFVKALDDIWDSGMLPQSLKVGVLRPFLVRPQVPVETSDPASPELRAMTAREIFLAILLYPLNWWIHRDRRIDHVIGNAFWRCLAMLLTLGTIAEALILAFLHHLPSAIFVATAILGLVLFLLLMRWFGKGRILRGLWLALLSAGLMGGIVAALVNVEPPSGGAAGGWVLLPAALVWLSWTLLRRTDSDPSPPQENEPP